MLAVHYGAENSRLDELCVSLEFSSSDGLPKLIDGGIRPDAASVDHHHLIRRLCCVSGEVVDETQAPLCLGNASNTRCVRTRELAKVLQDCAVDLGRINAGRLDKVDVLVDVGHDAGSGSHGRR